MATYRGFPWRKVPSTSKAACHGVIISSTFFLVYILAQVLGGVVGAGLVYANYIHAIDVFEGGNHIRTEATASLFATYAVSLSFEGSQFT